MTKAEEAVKLAFELANDDTHGYDQANRWGPDFDCSSAIIYIWEKIGVKVKSAGATYTGNMYSVFKLCGFEDVTNKVNRITGSGLELGDILLNHRNHVAMFVGSGKVFNASINEKGTVTGGKTGDQTGKEIRIVNYYNYPWNCVLRYTKDMVTKKIETKPTTQATDTSYYAMYPVKLPILKKGDKGEYVKSAQLLLIGRDFSCGGYGADGDFGNATFTAVKNYQMEKNLHVDGEIGPETWAKLLGQ